MVIRHGVVLLLLSIQREVQWWCCGWIWINL